MCVWVRSFINLLFDPGSSLLTEGFFCGTPSLCILDTDTPKCLNFHASFRHTQAPIYRQTFTVSLFSYSTTFPHMHAAYPPTKSNKRRGGGINQQLMRSREWEGPSRHFHLWCTLPYCYNLHVPVCLTLCCFFCVSPDLCMTCWEAK